MALAAVLVGAPGSGKTTVGRELAAALGVPFRDSDDEVVALAGMSIPEMFVQYGEEHFRALEREAVRGVLQQAEGVVALGGGAVLSDEVREALAGLPVVWLQVSASEGVVRAGLSGPRPVLLGNVRGQWAALLQQREPLYRAVARWEVPTTGRTPDEVCQDILQRLDAAHG